MTEVDLGATASFIGAWYVSEVDVCDELVGYFNVSGGRIPGQVGIGTTPGTRPVTAPRAAPWF